MLPSWKVLRSNPAIEEFLLNISWARFLFLIGSNSRYNYSIGYQDQNSRKLTKTLKTVIDRRMRWKTPNSSAAAETSLMYTVFRQVLFGAGN